MLRHWIAGAALAVGTAIGAGQPAQAQMFDKMTVPLVQQALTNAGLTSQAFRDGAGDPALAITSLIPGAGDVAVIFYDCNELDQCEDITMWGWLEGYQGVPAEAIHVWNDVFRGGRTWSRAYKDVDNDLALTLNINATGGIGVRALQILINTHLADLGRMQQFLGGGLTGVSRDEMVNRLTDIVAASYEDDEMNRAEASMLKAMSAKGFDANKPE